MQDSTWGLTRAEQSGRITSLNLLDMLLFVQPRIELAFWAVSIFRWLMFSFSSTSTPKSFSAGLLSIPSSLKWYWYWGFPQPRCRTLHLAFWTSRGSHGPTSQGCPGPSVCHPVPQACHPHHSSWCRLKTWWGWTQFHYVIDEDSKDYWSQSDPWGTPLLTDEKK